MRCASAHPRSTTLSRAVNVPRRLYRQWRPKAYCGAKQLPWEFVPSTSRDWLLLSIGKCARCFLFRPVGRKAAWHLRKYWNRASATWFSAVYQIRNPSFSSRHTQILPWNGNACASASTLYAMRRELSLAPWSSVRTSPSLTRRSRQFAKAKNDFACCSPRPPSRWWKEMPRSLRSTSKRCAPLELPILENISKQIRVKSIAAWVWSRLWIIMPRSWT